MVSKIRKILKIQSGFTLIEVMIALAIFGVFIVSFMTGQGYNVSDSTELRRELKLKEFAKSKMNELIISPPDFQESLTLRPDTGKFDSDKSYTFEVSYKRFKIPDLNKIRGKEADDDQGSDKKKKIFELVKKNIEEIIWQVEVKVIDSNSGHHYSVSTWLTNEKAPVKLDAF